MSQAEEAIARALLHALEQVMDPGCLAIEGVGVHWSCVVKDRARRATIACFSQLGESEYLTEFEESGSSVAWGRTSSSMETCNAVARWAGGESLGTIYRDFAFVEANKRALDMLLRTASLACPELEVGVASAIDRDMCDLHKLTIEANDRAVLVGFYGKNEHPDAYFIWDGCIVATARIVPSDFGPLLRDWLLARYLPSVLSVTYEYVRVRPEARFYEEGRGLEGEFIVSWDRLATFYEESPFAIAAFAKQYLAHLRELGFHKTLRAGQSLLTAILSRSRRHGLGNDQVFLSLDFGAGEVRVAGKLSGGTIRETTYRGNEPPQELVALLKELERHPIDGAAGGAG